MLNEIVSLLKLNGISLNFEEDDDYVIKTETKELKTKTKESRSRS